ncbi:hypothetical protein M404DRAFT_1001607 [Pisolithus tinctorius Marx 270]|uniref:Uncharacterized protein n=1 Tax=Pisolithus tinctorius Marx 270 TaxID=870435 RepID=A0A0C3J1M6_PISTI|nr:hypothetical protein M404DRAFT_1001607 [Pisolithus tinctorius Marx 270]
MCGQSQTRAFFGRDAILSSLVPPSVHRESPSLSSEATVRIVHRIPEQVVQVIHTLLSRSPAPLLLSFKHGGIRTVRRGYNEDEKVWVRCM